MIIDGKEIIDVYITKYALTEGILVRKAYLCDDVCNDVNAEMIRVVEVSNDGSSYKNYGVNPYFHKNEWFRTQEEAVKRADEMKAKKIKSLEKQLTKLTHKTTWKIS